MLKRTPPTYYHAQCVIRGQDHGGRHFGAWAHSPEEARPLIDAAAAERDHVLPAETVLETRKFSWSDGRLLYAHVEQSEHRAQQEAESYREDRRNQGAWSVRVFQRKVRAGDTEMQCWAVVVRHKFEPGNATLRRYR